MRSSIEEARRRYAEELRFTAKLGSRAVIDAFATVPREHFFGPGPWCLLSKRAPGECGRDPAAEERLKAAMAKSDFTAIQSLRRVPDEPDHTCWVAGEGWWLSTIPVSKSC